MVGLMMKQLAKESKYAQMSFKQGIKKFGEKVIEAMLAEYVQLKKQGIFKPIHANELTRKERRMALRMISLIKLKQCGKMKGRAVADGRPQHRYIPKEDAALPTVHLESLIASLAINASKGQDVATADIGGAFLQANIDGEHVLLVMTGTIIDVLCNVNLSYKNYITTINGERSLYVKLTKGIYGIMKGAILWYKIFTTCLLENGFELNPYDPCVANKMVNNKQCTICWHVDDTKISHKDPKVVDEVLEMLQEHFGELAIVRGNKHLFVGMNFEIKNKQLHIAMPEYIKECIESFCEEIVHMAKTPAKGNLFEIDKLSKKLDEKRAEIFHHIVAKLLFVSKRSRIDIALTIAFLFTRVDKSTEDDWLKLKRLLEYMKLTIDMVRIVMTDNLNILRSFVDASYAIHMDMKNHTG